MRDLLTLPKAELHLHIEGTLEPELAFRLADRNGVRLPFDTVDGLRDAYRFDDLQSFLDLYYATMSVLRTERDFTELTREYLERSAAQGLVHVEVFFDPQAHTERGVSVETVIDGISAGLEDGGRRWGVTSELILCFLRDRPAGEAMDVLRAALRARPGSIAGVGLDSAEVGHPPAPFAEAYGYAASHGLRLVAHAGEEGPASSVRDALDVLGVERIDHGIRAAEDAGLVRRLAAERIPLTVCPLSNLRLRAVPSLAEHPLLRLLAAGVMVTVNSDDPAYFGGYIGDNYAAVRSALGLDDAQLATIARNGIAASWADAERKAELLARVDAWEQSPAP